MTDYILFVHAGTCQQCSRVIEEPVVRTTDPVGIQTCVAHREGLYYRATVVQPTRGDSPEDANRSNGPKGGLAIPEAAPRRPDAHAHERNNECHDSGMLVL